MIDIDALQKWVGRTEMRESRIAAWPADVLAATFDRDDPPLEPGDPIPPGWHWLYFPDVVKLSDIGPEGHANTGAFTPPAPLPRRMWGANRMTFHQALHVDETIRRESKVASIEAKRGTTGEIVLVTVRHEIFGKNGLATVEDHTTVYRNHADPNAPAPAPRPAPAKARWQRSVHPSPVLLFRYSALTMNSHRIHYDRDYTTQVEGYPGLLVHGPLTTTLLLDLFRREMPAATPKSFSVRAVSPLYDTADFTIAGAPADDGKTAKLWALNPDGALAMSADAEYST